MMNFASSAAFVDAIHTDVRFAGTGMSVGTVDFFTNDGVNPQPGCPPYTPVTLEQMAALQIPQNSELQIETIH